MAIIRWNPWNIERFLNEDWDLPTIPGLSRLMTQGLNLYETDNSVVAEVALPGIPEDRIDVTVDDDVVRVSGSLEEKQEDRKNRRYFMSSLDQSFNYTFRLPQEVVADREPVTEFINGVLRLEFAKAKKQAPKRIRISTRSKSGQEKM